MNSAEEGEVGEQAKLLISPSNGRKKKNLRKMELKGANCTFKYMNGFGVSFFSDREENGGSLLN